MTVDRPRRLWDANAYGCVVCHITIHDLTWGEIFEHYQFVSQKITLLYGMSLCYSVCHITTRKITNFYTRENVCHLNILYKIMVVLIEERVLFCLNFPKNTSSESYFAYNHSIGFLQTQVFLKCIFSVTRCKARECFCSPGPIRMIQYHSSESGQEIHFPKIYFLRTQEDRQLHLQFYT